MRHARRFSVLLALGLAGTLSGAPAAHAQARLLVLSKGDLTMAIVDPATGRVEARVPSGPDPHEVVASTDGARAYISNYGGGTDHRITPVDLVRREALPVIDLTPLRGPHGLDFAGGKLWFTVEGSGAVGRYDPATRKVDWTVRTGQDRTHMLAVSPDASRVIATNTGSGTVSLIEREGAGSEWRQTVLPAGGGVEGFDVSPDGREVWAANARDGTITVIDLASRKVAHTIPANVRSANRLEFTPDGRRVLVSMLGEGNVAVFDAASRAEVERIPVGSGAAGILVQPDGARAYVACTPDDYVAIIDLRSLEVVGRIDAGRRPDGLAWVGTRDEG